MFLMLPEMLELQQRKQVMTRILCIFCLILREMRFVFVSSLWRSIAQVTFVSCEMALIIFSIVVVVKMTMNN